MKTDTIYYGLWPDTKNNKVEYDILYTIGSIDKGEIQRHLNLHDHMNDELAQKMALIIDKDGKWKIQNNKKSMSQFQTTSNILVQYKHHDSKYLIVIFRSQN